MMTAIDQPPIMTIQREAVERDAINALLQLGLPIDEARAREVLERYKWNVDNAASSLFNDAPFESDEPPPLQPITAKEWETDHSIDPELLSASLEKAYRVRRPTPPVPVIKSRDIIDLTGEEDDEDLKRAMAISLQNNAVDVPPSSQLTPSTRTDDKQQWAMVPTKPQEQSSVIGPVTADEALSRAVQASLDSSTPAETYEELSIDQQVRLPEDRPVALRTSLTTQAPMALLLQALYAIPPIRDAFKRYRAPTDMSPAVDAGGDFIDYKLRAHKDVQAIQRLFANMELTQKAYIKADRTLLLMGVDRPATWQSPSNVTHEFLSRIAESAERMTVTCDPPQSDSLDASVFTCYGGSIGTDPFSPNATTRLFTVATGGFLDIPSALTALLWTSPNSPQAFFKLPNLLYVQINDSIPTGNNKRTPFRFTSSFYLDPWLVDNINLVAEKRSQMEAMRNEIMDISRAKEKLIRHENKDVLVQLRATLHYLENLTMDGGDLERRAKLNETCMKLKKAIAHIQGSVQSIDERTKLLTESINTAFDVPELQKHPFNLCSVLVHDGLPGRNHVFSYIRSSGKWWKSVDHTVTEAGGIYRRDLQHEAHPFTKVSEQTVLNDSIGLHLGAGPYALFYANALDSLTDGDVTMNEGEPSAPPEPPVWPKELSAKIREENATFRILLPEDVAERLRVQDVPPSHEARPIPSAPPADEIAKGTSPPEERDGVRVQP
ncbi:hypothetical protein BOTBODRAFT_189177 [Botryobasidium botryosum FD-172 SS1]|uniref:UBA domain-containing protein n=1 Tax=Botryobasidium botryosum (strain FD-172 SS1) TaxID=930990 RepID=A0A067MA62_BOTB1|nr:hypothetical protein BOTBODRAFT_189177 [Botryobasidium botryosum FD-172 SS1]